MADLQARMQILEMIESGQISAEEGLRRLQALPEDQTLPDTDEALPEALEAGPVLGDTGPASARPGADSGGPDPYGQPSEATVIPGHPPTRTPLPDDIEKWRRWWMIPFWIGVSLTILGAMWMYTAQQGSGFGLGFFCAWLPFLAGLGLVVLIWQSRSSRWLHLRVHQKPGEWPERIAISFPLPIHLTAWFLRTFRGHIPGLEGTSVDEMIIALGETATPENPLYLEVDEGEDGEKVQIYIG